MKVFLLLALLALLAGTVTSAHASTRGELGDILGARSVKELETRTRATNELRRTRESCASELRTHLLPRACFRELTRTPDTLKRERLTRVCVQNAKSSRSRLDLGGSTKDLPDECKKVASERLEDLQYIDEAKSPETSVLRTSGPNLEDISSD